MASRNGKPGLQVKKVSGHGDIKKMDPMQKARYMAYEQPSKAIAASLVMTQNRLKEHALKTVPGPKQQILDPEQERQKKVVGQLKAAEARNRIRLLRIRFQCNRRERVEDLLEDDEGLMTSRIP